MKSQVVFSRTSNYLKTFVSIGVVLLSGAMLYFLAYASYNDYNLIKQEIRVEDSKLVELNARLAQLDKIKRIASTIETTDKLTKETVSVESEIPIVMAMIQVISKDSGVALRSLSYTGDFVSDYSMPAKIVTNTDPNQSGSDTSSSSKTGDSSGSKTTSQVPSVSMVEDAFRVSGEVVGKMDNLIQLIKNFQNSRRILDLSGVSYQVDKKAGEEISDLLALKFVISSYYKDFATIKDPLTDINFERFTPLLSKLNKANFIQIDLTNVNVGKIDPFSTGGEGSTGPAPINLVEPSKSSTGFDSLNNSSEINVVELEGTGSVANDSSPTDVEAENTGNVSDTLLKMLQQEGVR